MHNRSMLASILFFFTGFVSVAQSTDTPTPPPPMPPPPPGLPIDNGIFIVLILALVYGIYKTNILSNKAD